MKNLMIVMVALVVALVSVVPALAQGEVPLSNGRTAQADYEGRAPKVGDGTTTNYGADKLRTDSEFQGAGDAGDGSSN